MKISNFHTKIIAFILLSVMFFSCLFSLKKEALTFDELAHVGAGYSYLTKQDYRINPEHPPLIKDIPALPLLFLNLNFPDKSPVWTQEDESPAWWVQFDLGREFLYQSGNNPRQIIFWARLAMVFLLILLGLFLFYWSKKIGGNFVALTTLALFSFSPTFLAHGRLINTDIGAVLGSLIAVFFWIEFLKNPNWSNILKAGIGFGLAMVLKFSLVLLIPFFVVITFLYVLLFSKGEKVIKKIITYTGKSLLVALVGIVFVVWPIYQFHILNYPPEQQLRDTIADISGHPIPVMKDVAIWMTQQQPLRGLGQYLRGLLMASQRTVWGNTTFFMGKISAESWLHYFPTLYLFKLPLAFHLLSLIALLGIILAIKKLKKNFTIIAIFLWILVYWAAALLGNLNIGIRHLLPSFPFIYIIVALGISKLISLIKFSKIKQYLIIFVFVLFGWYAFSSISTFPHYISYYNEFAGGTKEGYKIAVDSNYDWGQDFYYLLDFIEKQKINKIYLDYFGGEDPQYWLGEKYVKLNPKEMKEPPKGWVAVSLNQLMGGIAEPVTGFDQETGYYNWLNKHEPVARAGMSIFIYNTEE